MSIVASSEIFEPVAQSQGSRLQGSYFNTQSATPSEISDPQVFIFLHFLSIFNQISIENVFLIQY